MAWRLALPVVMGRFWWRGRREPQYRKAWAMRLGWWSTAAHDHRKSGQDKNESGQDTASRTTLRQPRIWLHAVSLGETRAAEPLVAALRERLPSMQLILTTGTATGWDAGLSLLRDGDRHGWVPLDTPGSVRRFLSALRPDIGVLMETETWPNLVAVARSAGMPMVLANARLSERSLGKGLRWPSLTRPMMASLSAVLAQSEPDARRLIQVGATPQAVSVCGHMKYDLTPPDDLLVRGRRWRASSAAGRRIVLAASWREGEDEPLLHAWLRVPMPRPLLLLVPRHPQRFDAVERLVLAQGLRVARRSEGALDVSTSAAQQTDQTHGVDVVLGDSLGEMPSYYACADVALLGGSFAPLGGQNLIEAAACGCPLVMGPHTFNFSDAAQGAIKAGAAVRVADLDAAVTFALSATDQECGAMSRAGQAFAADHRGATARMADRITALLR